MLTRANWARQRRLVGRLPLPVLRLRLELDQMAHAIRGSWSAIVAHAAAGAIVAFVCGRRAYGVMDIVAAIAVTLAVWGVVQVVSAQRTIATIDDHLADLAKERERLERIINEEG